MAACREHEEAIAAAVYEAPGPALQAHLKACAGCLREFEELQRTSEVLATGRVEAAPGDRAEVLAGLAKRIDSRATGRRTYVVRRGWGAPAAAAAAILLSIGAVVLLWPKPREIQPAPAAVVPAKVETPPAPKLPEIEPPRDLPIPAIPRPEEPKPVPPPEPVRPQPGKPAPPEPEKPAPPPPPKERPTVAVMAKLEDLRGAASVRSEEGRVAAKAGFELRSGQEIEVAGHAVVAVADGTRIELFAGTALRLVSDHRAGETGRIFEVARGLVAATVAKQPQGFPMLFRTPGAEAKVLGTQFVLAVKPDATRLEVREGRVRLTRLEDKAGVDVPAGSFATAAKGPAPAARPGRAWAGLVALYTFDEGQGGTVHDVAGAGAPLDLEVRNPGAVQWAPGGLLLKGNTRIWSGTPAKRLIDACRRSNEVTVEAWVAPERAALDFEGAIVALAADVTDRNFALVQGDGAAKDVFAASLRTTSTDAGGRPHLASPKGAAEPRLTHLVYTRSSTGAERLYVNGVERAAKVREGSFSGWDESYRLILGNEASEERPWAGTYSRVALYSRALAPAEILRHFRLGAD
jgi:hypothetical protein